SLKQDSRKGIQQLLKKWEKQQERQRVSVVKYEQMNEYEYQLREAGFKNIVGIDEAGRGPLAGPVVAGAVMLHQDRPIIGVDDSKNLSKEKRDFLYDEIFEKAKSVGVGIVDAQRIDQMNIYRATQQAMLQAVECLEIVPDYMLIDAMKITIPIQQSSLIKGDQRSVSIAAGSIIAKVTRDRIMQSLDQEYPEYGFARHFGYGTKEHLQALYTYG